MTVLTRAATRTLPLAAATLLTAALAGCGTVDHLLGGASSATAPTAAPAAAPAAAPTATAPDPEADRAEVRRTFTRYMQALPARDFGTACELMTPEAVSAVQQGAAQVGLSASSCEDAFAAVYGNPQAAAVLDESSRGIEVGDVTVVGDRATVAFTARLPAGRTAELSGGLRRVDGEWRVLPNS